jgi:uncharacterized delta-60 repeat protein
MKTINGPMTSSRFEAIMFERLERRLHCHAGDLDSTFGLGGIAQGNSTGGDWSHVVLAEPDGKTIAIGGFGDDGTNVAAYRLNADGSLDSTFGNGGVAPIHFGAPGSTASELAAVLDSQGRIVISASARHGGDSQSWLARLNPNGSPDASFGDAGSSLLPFPDFQLSNGPEGLAVAPDGSIVVAGGEWPGQTHQAALLRVRADGSMDSSFGIGGEAVLDFGRFNIVTATAIFADGRIALMSIPTDGLNLNLDNGYVVAALNAHGGPDPSFGFGGSSTVVSDAPIVARSMAITAEGQLVVFGAQVTSDSGAALGIVLTRFNTAGTIDNSFTLQSDLDSPLHLVTASDFKLQSDGKIVALGSYRDGSDFKSAVARFNTDGSTDTTFGTAGVVPIGNSLPATIVGLDILPDGDVALTGTLHQRGHGYVVYRLVGGDITSHHPPTNSHGLAVPRPDLGRPVLPSSLQHRTLAGEPASTVDVLTQDPESFFD